MTRETVDSVHVCVTRALEVCGSDSFAFEALDQVAETLRDWPWQAIALVDPEGRKSVTWDRHC